MPSPEPTLQTKWGRLTGAQWLEARHREAMDNWWTPEVEAYVVENWPAPEQLASVARADRDRPGSGFRSRTTTPTQLAIL
jgi:hypothetical protein